MTDEQKVSDEQELAFSDAVASTGGEKEAIEGDPKMFPPRDWGAVKKPGLFARLIRWLAQAWVDFQTWRENKELVVKFKKLNPKAIPPRFSRPRDSGADLASLEELVIPPGEVRMVSTGIAIQLPPGYEAQVRSRSGLAAKNWVHVLNSPGTVDEGYRGEVCVILYNAGKIEFKVEREMRIAQLVVKAVPRVVYKAIDNLSETERGEGGFGSTGVK